MGLLSLRRVMSEGQESPQLLVQKEGAVGAGVELTSLASGSPKFKSHLIVWPWVSHFILFVNECMTSTLGGAVSGLNEITQNNDNVYFAPESAVEAGLSRMIHQGQFVPALLSFNGSSSKAGAGAFQSCTHRSVVFRWGCRLEYLPMAFLWSLGFLTSW